MTLYDVQPHAAFVSAAANNASVFLWSPAAGKRFVMTGCVISASVTGRYQVVDGAQVLFDGILLANTETPLPMGGEERYRSAALGQSLQFVNLSGAAANMGGTAYGWEDSF